MDHQQPPRCTHDAAVVGQRLQPLLHPTPDHALPLGVTRRGDAGDPGVTEDLGGSGPLLGLVRQQCQQQLLGFKGQACEAWVLEAGC
jgi:hypothetical protein